MGDRFEIRVAGSGGQGVILAAVILGEAAALRTEGLNSVQSQAYGPEARGGASKSEVVYDREEIDYPKASHPNLQIILTQKACDTYSHDTAKGATVIFDDFFVTNPPKLDAEVYMLPIVKTAREKLGREIVVNMVALGTAAKALEDKGLTKPQAIKDAILARVPKGTEELNEKAFDEGYKMMCEAVAARKK
ncbi:2-oxoacid:acceptor oxidoreductase family protein [Synergistes jonesii]|uniref:2-oxoglutarate ferredoxin oxidoreductase subunit gamma n=2 Tax=Synergistes jonesii TaxID=2754 RepID=A0A073J145_9BACT|nr:2-oxoacid:acceptor oxidoreductase family protein [Synergistes jonesii]KEJ91412.1 2-oxoglutarate ferredoxin oxidoreductase subunit gamma [Synergistes jonesii]OFB60473.1 2-oxoglutarate ferredoxin oxidoreductase subunit gamma [Synergistes jonesii]OFB61483.1 2-oxoglutarate ferredoxin oxidoreductase subunit gamma [Synergistes jonesii]OFB64454.1 2-oxoglutarate ferredoxin oxidoreductase subunit gamma [Synergistes jonesii]OFB66775.1 2-oxoglutarate ferredoxin oxidoreductase subunit gamma [Synergiste